MAVLQVFRLSETQPLRGMSTLHFSLRVVQKQRSRIKQNFTAKRWGEMLRIQALQPPLQMSTLLHSHGEREGEMPPLSRAKRLQLIPVTKCPPTALHSPETSPGTAFLCSTVTDSKIQNGSESSRGKNRKKKFTHQQKSNKKHFPYCVFAENYLIPLVKCLSAVFLEVGKGRTL